MFPRWMAPIDPEKLELNPTREGRALQCLSEAACPGGRLQQDAVKPMCSEGRTGVLCAACTTEYYATKGECKRCTEVSQEDKLHLWGIAAGVAAIGLGLAGMAWLSRGAATEYWQQADVQWHVLKELAARQAVVLLQVVQLYGVLAALVPDPSTGQGARESFWERTYVDALQLNLAQAQDAFRFQCLWDGDKVRLVFALASPIVPLVLLLACVLLEIIKPSMGTGATLKVLTIVFIGGARESAALLRCQLVDKGGARLDDFAFLQKLPFLPCSKTEGVAKWVYAVGYGAGAIYVAVIPAALLFLYMRQHIVLRPSKTVTAHAKRAKSSWITKLHSVKASEPMQVNDEHLLAAAVAHMVVTFQGKVWLQLQGGKAEMKSSEREGRAPAELTVSSFLEGGDEVEEMLRSRAIMEMLVERCEMEKASEKNRLLSGAKEVFFKYAFCRFVWMEMAQKLLAVGLVTVITTEDGLHLSLACVLGMAATIAMVQPYIQPQMNELHIFSLLCLAAAALGFAGAADPKAHWLWLSRVSVLLPFLLAAAQVLRPDSCEALAVRLFQEARRQLKALQEGQEVELVVKTVSFI